jgi:hypothetical protein
MKHALLAGGNVLGVAWPGTALNQPQLGRLIATPCFGSNVQ